MIIMLDNKIDVFRLQPTEDHMTSTLGKGLIKMLKPFIGTRVALCTANPNKSNLQRVGQKRGCTG